MYKKIICGENYNIKLNKKNELLNLPHFKASIPHRSLYFYIKIKNYIG
jgi:hypothetical protein